MIQIDFKPLGVDTQYSLQIDDGGTGVPTMLDGTRDVFTTNEDDDADVFLPVRTTSGTIRFYNTGNAWNTLADFSTSHKEVTLLAGGSVAWKGYINKRYVGSRRIFGYEEECEINVQCPLMELDTEEYDPLQGDFSNISMMSLSAIIADILKLTINDTPTAIPSTMTDDLDVAMVAGLYVTPLSFYKEAEDDNGARTFEPKYTKKGALEVVMKQLCCTARWDGVQVFIEAYKPSTTTTSDGALSVNPADTECSETAVMPFKKVSVKAEANGGASADDSPIELPTQAMQNWVEENLAQAIQPERAKVIGTMTQWVAWIWGVVGGTYTNPDDWRNITDGEYEYRYENYVPTSSGGTKVYVTGYEGLGTSPVTKTRYNLGAAVLLHYNEVIPTDQSNPALCPTFVVVTKTPITVQDAYLALQMKMKMDFYDSQFDGILEVAVRIGDYVYDYTVSAWRKQVTDSFFEVEYEDGQIKTSENLNPYFGNVQGYGMPVFYAYDEHGTVTSANLNGFLTVKVRTRNTGTTGTDFSDDVITIETMKVEIVRRTVDTTEKDTFTASGVGSGIEDVELSYCSVRQKDNADNFLYSDVGTGGTHDYAVVKNLSFDEGSMRPEQWVAERHKAMTIGRARKLLVIRQLGDIADGKYTYGGTLYQTLLKKHEWAENITEIQLIELTAAS